MDSIIKSPRTLRREPDNPPDQTPVKYLPACAYPCQPSPQTTPERVLLEPRPSDASYSSQAKAPLKHERSPARSTSSSLTDAATLTPDRLVPPVTAFSMLNGNGSPPPAKKQKLSYSEKEEQNMLKEIRQRERAEERARKEVDKAQRDHEKAQRDAEKEAERKKKDAEKEHKRLMKDVENAEKERIKAAKDEERRKKEEEKEKLEEEKRKKERAQPKLNAFFATSKAKVAIREVSPAILAPCATAASKQAEVSDYERMFPPFFLKEHVILAPSNWFSQEQWRSQTPEDTIDSFIAGGQEAPILNSFDASTLFNCPHLGMQPRGKTITPVRDIMTRAHGKQGHRIDLTIDSQNTPIEQTRKLLQTVPYKIIKFSHDVRPPYCGTHTRYELSQLKRLARRPTKPELKDLYYDYDSEAEWVEDGEEDGAEDLVSDGGEEEDDENDDEADGFIDDAEVESVLKRAFLPADQEPKSTGLCWEDHRRKTSNIQMYGYRMEIMHENADIKAPIDPFSKSYWEGPKLPTGMEPPRVPLRAMKATNTTIAQGPGIPQFFGGKSTVPSTSPSASTAAASSQAASVTAPAQLLTDPADITTFRELVDYSTLTKVGLLEVVHQQMKHKSSIKRVVKNSLEAWAVRVGGMKKDAVWGIKEDVCPKI